MILNINHMCASVRSRAAAPAASALSLESMEGVGSLFRSSLTVINNSGCPKKTPDPFGQPAWPTVKRATNKIRSGRAGSHRPKIDPGTAERPVGTGTTEALDSRLQPSLVLQRGR